jgi:hypothetical protein
MAKLKSVCLQISTWIGSIGAEHYYGHLKGHDVNGEYQSIELEWPLSQKMATYLNKKEGTRTGETYSFYRKGQPTYRFDTKQEVRDWAIKVWRDHFPGCDILLEGGYSYHEPKWCLDGDSMIVESINQIVDKWNSLDDMRIPGDLKKGDALTEIFYRVINSGDHTAGYSPTHCPKCGGEDGYYTREIVKFRSMRFFYNNATEGEVGDLIRGGDKWYCMCCDRDITKLVQPFIAIENM